MSRKKVQFLDPKKWKNFDSKIDQKNGKKNAKILTQKMVQKIIEKSTQKMKKSEKISIKKSEKKGVTTHRASNTTKSGTFTHPVTLEGG